MIAGHGNSNLIEPGGKMEMGGTGKMAEKGEELKVNDPASTALLRKTTTARSDAPAQMVAFHPDGRRWAVAGPGMVYLWDGETLVQAFRASPTQGLAFSDDGRQLLASPHRIDVERRQVDSRADVLSKAMNLGGASYDLVASGLSPDSTELLAVASFRPGRGLGKSDERPRAPEQILLIDAATQKLRKVLFRGTDTQCQAVANSVEFLAVADLDVWLWPRRGSKARRVLHGPAFQVRELRFSPDGKLLGAVDAGGMATLWETANGTLRARWKVHEDNAPRLAFHPRLPVLATGSGDAAIKLWSIPASVAGSGPGDTAPSLLAVLAEQGGFVEGLAFSPSGDRLLAAIGGQPVMYDVKDMP